MTTALERWKRQIERCREDRAQPDAKHWENAAAWYETWVQDNDYVEKTLPFLQPFLAPEGKVLEIGAGTGAFTLPLAQEAERMIALEPSSGMRDILTRKLEEENVKNVQVLPEKIEQALPVIQEAAPFQLIFASFALYNVAEINDLLATLLPLTHHLAILLGSGAISPWKEALYRQFRKEIPPVPPQLDYLYPVLLDMRLYAAVHIIPASQNYVFSSQEELITWWSRKLQIEDQQRAELQAALRPLIQNQHENIGIFQERLMALVCLDRVKQPPPRKCFRSYLSRFR